MDNVLIRGYVDSNTFLRPGGIEVLDREGHLLTVPLQDVKGVFFVRDFDGDSNRPERKVFYSRPKRAGLWIRLRFKDNELLEGLIPNDLLDLPVDGFLVTPPDMYSNNLKIFIPRTALASLEVVGVISKNVERQAPQPAAEARRAIGRAPVQIRLFPTRLQSESE